MIESIGSDAAAGAEHYITTGYAEGRTITFDASLYLARHADVRAVYGNDEELAKQHYINNGYDEGRVIA